MKKLILAVMCAMLSTSGSWASSASSPDSSAASTLEERSALMEDFKNTFEQFTQAAFRDPVLDAKMEESAMENIMAAEHEVLDALGPDINPAKSLTPAKKAIKKFMMLLCDPLGLKPNEDMPAKELVDLVSKHLKDKYKV